MREIFKIKDIEEIYSILDNSSYGTLALSKGVVPYSVPINFARVKNCLYMHGSKKGKKMDFLKHNKNVSFSIVGYENIIPSYFSSKNGLACQATTFFSSVIIEGVAQIITNYDEKVIALEAIMQKLQPSGGYKSLNQEVYKKAINATAIIKIIPYEISAKAKFGQNLDRDRFNMIIENLEKSSCKDDLQLIDKLRRYYDL